MDLVIQNWSKGELLFDKNGSLARLGKPRASTVSQLLAHPYFRKAPPKSTGRDDFTWKSLKKNLGTLPLADALATTTLATAKSIVDQYRRFILDRGLPLSTVYFCGGGAKNRALLECIQIELLQRGWHVDLQVSDSLGVSTQDMEAAAFAFLGHESLLGHALGGAWTGTNRFGPPGQLTPGKNWPKVLKKLRLEVDRMA
jgi:anhydro-N-acetylmuramic acid kinase